MTTRVVSGRSGSGHPLRQVTSSEGWRDTACWAAESISLGWAADRWIRTTPLPSITKPFDLLWQEDLLPYRRLVRQLPMVMVSHAAYSASGPGAGIDLQLLD